MENQAMQSWYTGFWLWVSIIFSVLVVVILGILAWLVWEMRKLREATYRFVIETQTATRASLASQLLSEYASEDMLVAMRELRAWQEKHPEDFAERYASLRKREDAAGLALDSHRRRVARYFAGVVMFCEAGLIDDTLIFKGLGLPDVAGFVFEVLEPINRVHAALVTGTKHDTHTYDFLNRQLQSSR